MEISFWVLYKVFAKVKFGSRDNLCIIFLTFLMENNNNKQQTMPGKRVSKKKKNPFSFLLPYQIKVNVFFYTYYSIPINGGVLL